MEYLSTIAVGLMVIAVICVLFYYKKITVDNIINWLLWAVTEAEDYFGDGTGKLKLAYVYSLFTRERPVISRLISFETFSDWVDIALYEMRKMLENPKIKEYIEAIKYVD